jgi:hypothetical protein
VGSTTTSLTTWKANVESTAQVVTAGYANPIRSIAGYNSSIGGTASLSDFVDGAAYQMQGSYDDAYSAAAVINYVRKGFAEGGVVREGGTASWADIAHGLDLTGHFLMRDLLTQKSAVLGEARERLVDRLRRAGGLD